MPDETTDNDGESGWEKNARKAIARLAESNGRSESQIIEDLIASHWTLQELLRQVDLKGDFDETDPAIVDRLQAPDEGSPSDLEIRLDEIEEQLERLHAPNHPSGRTETARAVDDSAPEPPLATHRERPEDLERAIAHLHDEFRELHDRIGQLEDKTDSAAQSRSDVYDELVNIRQVLEYLITVTDRLEQQDQPSSASPSAEREPADGTAHHRELLVLTRQAAEHGVTEARCQHCSTTVDIPTLETASCPHCGREFERVQPRSGWLPFGSHTLAVSSE